MTNEDVNKMGPKSHAPQQKCTIHAPPVFHFDLLATLYLWEKVFLRLHLASAGPLLPNMTHSISVCFAVSVSILVKLSSPRRTNQRWHPEPQKFSCQRKIGQFRLPLLLAAAKKSLVWTWGREGEEIPYFCGYLLVSCFSCKLLRPR